MRWCLLLMAGCSLNNLDVRECETDRSCREAFGLGSVCASDGYCTVPELHPRCDTVPTDLFENPDAYLDAIALGHLWRNQSFDIERRAVDLAFTHVNDNEGLDGREYVLVSCDTEARPEIDDLDGEDATMELATYLSSDLALPAIIGATSSPETQAAYTLASEEGTLLITPSSTSPALTSLDGLTCSDEDPGLLWRTVPPDELQGLVIAEDLESRGIDRIALIYEEGSYGEGLANAIAINFDGSLMERLPFSEQSDLGEATVDAGNAGVSEVVFITSSVDFVSDFLAAAATLNSYASLGIFLADAAYNQGIYDGLMGTAAEELFGRIRGTRPTIDEDSSVLQTFVASYSVAYDGEDASTAGFSAYAYDAAWLAIYGSAWAHYQEDSGIDGISMARGLRHISNGTTVNVQSSRWNDIRAHFENGEGVDLVGASGDLDYDVQTCETSAPIEIWNLEGSVGSDWELSTLDIIE